MKYLPACLLLLVSLGSGMAGPDPKDRPVALVNGTPILALDFQLEFIPRETTLQFKFGSEPRRLEQEITQARHDVLDTLIDAQLMVDEFQRTGGVITPEALDQDMDTVIKDWVGGDRASFLSVISKLGLTLEKFRSIRERLLIADQMRHRFAGTAEVKVTDEQVRDCYERNQERWSAPKEVKIHTLSLLKSDATSRSRAESLRTQILQGADMEALARAESKDSHAKDGGAWDWTPVTSFSADMCTAVTTTPKGSLSDIIEQTGGFILLRLDDSHPPAPQPFEAVKVEAAALLQDELAKQRIEVKLEELRKKADIQKLGPL